MQAKKWGTVLKQSPCTHDEIALESYIRTEIKNNNCLALPDEELDGMSRLLAKSKTHKEVFDWADTLLLGESFAKQVIKRREDYDLPFEGEPISVDRALSAVPLNAAKRKSAGGVPKAPRRGKRNAKVMSMPQRSAEAASVQPGKFECECFATLHNLRGSCANCGRIICEQEADDVCYYCGLEPVRSVAYEIAVLEGKISKAALDRDRESYKAAIARRDTLLEYACNRAKRTVVIDDQAASLFSGQNAWMTPEERCEQEKNLADREKRKKLAQEQRFKGPYQVQVDFAKAKISFTASDNTKEEEMSKECDTMSDPPSCTDADAPELPTTEPAPLAATEGGMKSLPDLLQRIWYNPPGLKSTESKLNESPVIQGIGELRTSAVPKEGIVKLSEAVLERVQHNYFEDDMQIFFEEKERQQELVFIPEVAQDLGGELKNDEGESSTAEVLSPPVCSTSDFALSCVVSPLMRLRDDGICLSLHQPWASLLVSGIKTHEGRGWSTPYRGRLWIHAAASIPENVEETERHYAQFAHPSHVFPKHYPTKVLLGYVYLTSCLDRESYKTTFPSEQHQVESSFTFVCVEPKMLPFPLPMCGGHKLFTLDRKVHAAARKQLMEI